tara:strand:+ start:2448 stop:3428 length:981 start_codon:yes stop_codon:yes gene_type:complete
MKKNILITGITGFVGSHLADYILSLNERNNLYGIKRWHLSRTDNIDHIADKVELIDCNIVDPVSTRNAIMKVKPDVIFHCAAESFVSPSWDNPHQYMNVNYFGTVNLLESIKEIVPNCYFHIPGSGEEYGEINENEIPINTDTVLRPVNPYAVTKIAQDLIGYVYYKSYNLKVIRTRAFNHEGPRREKVFGIPWYAYQIARIEKGLQDPLIKVGEIDDKRNFTHVKDMVKAYWMSVDKCTPGELYLVGSERNEDIFTFREALEKLISMSTVNNLTYKTVPEYTRPTNVPRLIADTSKFNKITGWEPQIGFEQILIDTLDYWRNKNY